MGEYWILTGFVNIYYDSLSEKNLVVQLDTKFWLKLRKHYEAIYEPVRILYSSARV